MQGELCSFRMPHHRNSADLKPVRYRDETLGPRVARQVKVAKYVAPTFRAVQSHDAIGMTRVDKKAEAEYGLAESYGLARIKDGKFFLNQSAVDDGFLVVP